MCFLGDLMPLGHLGVLVTLGRADSPPDPAPAEPAAMAGSHRGGGGYTRQEYDALAAQSTGNGMPLPPFRSNGALSSPGCLLSRGPHASADHVPASAHVWQKACRPAQGPFRTPCTTVPPPRPAMAYFRERPVGPSAGRGAAEVAAADADVGEGGPAWHPREHPASPRRPTGGTGGALFDNIFPRRN